MIGNMKEKVKYKQRLFVFLLCNHYCGQCFNINKRGLSGPQPNSFKSYLATLKIIKRSLFFLSVQVGSWSNTAIIYPAKQS